MRNTNIIGLSKLDAIMKSSLDIFLAITGLTLTWWIIFIAAILATVDTRANGVFTQLRVGKNGKLFKVIKIRTMRLDKGISTTVTTREDPRITNLEDREDRCQVLSFAIRKSSTLYCSVASS